MNSILPYYTLFLKQLPKKLEWVLGLIQHIRRRNIICNRFLQLENVICNWIIFAKKIQLQMNIFSCKQHFLITKNSCKFQFSSDIALKKNPITPKDIKKHLWWSKKGTCVSYTTLNEPPPYQPYGTSTSSTIYFVILPYKHLCQFYLKRPYSKIGR